MMMGIKANAATFSASYTYVKEQRVLLPKTNVTFNSST